MIHIMRTFTQEELSQATPEELQKYADEAYEYAADLFLNYGMSWNDVREELVGHGLSEADADAIVNNLEEQESSARHSVANKELGYGVLWAAGGIFASILTDWTLIFWGAVAWGGWLILKGLYHHLS